MIPNIFDFPSNNIAPNKGKILISNPFTQDKYFKRSVILLTEHDAEGSFGFILNNPIGKKVSELVDSLSQFHSPIYLGGPVNNDYLFYIHSLGELIPNSHNLGNGLYWGGELESIVELFDNKLISSDYVHFYKGYSGWSPNQLSKEIENKSWIVSNINAKTLLQTPSFKLWKKAVISLGKKYQYWLNFPSDPIYN